MPLEERGLEVGRIAEPGQSLVQMGIVAEEPPRLRLGVHDRGPDVVRVRDRQQLRRRLEEDRGDRRVEGAARPAGHRLDRQLGAPDGVEHDRGEADRGEPRRLRHLIAGKPGRRPLAVEAFEGTQHGPAARPPAAAAAASGLRRPHSPPGPTPRRSWPPGGRGPAPAASRRRSRARPGTAAPPAGRVASIRSPRERTAMSSPPNAAAASCEVAAHPANRIRLA